jgi:hypothetical protein
MPMNTTLVTARSERASATCATISALPTCRNSPSRPVIQKRQPTAQPTWVETHSPPRGSSTDSTVCPSCRATSSRSEPSPAGWRDLNCTSPASACPMPGQACCKALGRKVSIRRRARSTGNACVQLRSRCASCFGPAPRLRSWACRAERSTMGV